MTTQPTVTALTSQKVADTVVDLASTDGAKKALGGAWPAAGLLGRADWVNKHKDATQRVVNALVATMHWIDEHSAADIANKLPAEYVNNATITKDQYIAGLTTDKGQFLPDGIMPAGGPPKTVLDMEKQLGLDTSKIDLSKTFTNDYAQKANKDAGTKVTTTPPPDPTADPDPGPEPHTRSLSLSKGKGQALPHRSARPFPCAMRVLFNPPRLPRP